MTDQEKLASMLAELEAEREQAAQQDMIRSVYYAALSMTPEEQLHLAQQIAGDWACPGPSLTFAPSFEAAMNSSRGSELCNSPSDYL